MDNPAYSDGYEDALSWKKKMDKEKGWYAGLERTLYDLGYKHATMDCGECYEAGRLSVVNCEDERAESEFGSEYLYYYYLLGRKHEMAA